MILLLDMKIKQTYLNRHNFQQVFNNLNSKDFFKTEDDNDCTKDSYLNNIDPDINYISNDTCNYTINVEDIIQNVQMS